MNLPALIPNLVYNEKSYQYIWMSHQEVPLSRIKPGSIQSLVCNFLVRNINATFTNLLKIAPYDVCCFVSVLAALT